MAKKSRSESKSVATKVRQTKPAQHSEGIAGKFGQITDTVSGITGRIPSSAIYWGLGALALGAAAVGAYLYRDNLVELYDDAKEALDTQLKGADTEEAAVTKSDFSRKSKTTSSSMNQNELI